MLIFRYILLLILLYDMLFIINVDIYYIMIYIIKNNDYIYTKI